MGPLTGADLDAFLQGAGLFSNPKTAPQKFIKTDEAIVAAAEDLERESGYFPFLSDGVSSPRVFDGPESSVLQLRSGLISLTSLSINGVSYAENSQFVLQPTDGPERKLPYTYVDFGSGWNSGGYGLGSDYAFGFGAGSQVGLGYVGGGRRSITVDGVWGFCSELPENVKQAILGHAAALISPRLLHLINRGQTAQTVGTDSWTWSPNALQNQVDMWRAEWTQMLSRPGMRLFRL